MRLYRRIMRTCVWTQMLIRDANLRRKECLPVRARRVRASDPREECLLVRSAVLLDTSFASVSRQLAFSTQTACS